MLHLLVHTNQDIKRRQNKDKDSTVHTKAKEIQQLNRGGPDQRYYIRPQISHLQTSLSRNRHRV